MSLFTDTGNNTNLPEMPLSRVLKNAWGHIFASPKPEAGPQGLFFFERAADGKI